MKQILLFSFVCLLAQIAQAQLVISEIMYRPQAPIGMTSGDLEFVELSNYGSETIDISGYSFTEGIFYTFPTNTTLAPGAYLTIARNSAALQSVHPSLDINGQYTGGLSNTGEELVLVNALAEELIHIEFDNSSPWPSLADGLGFSLVLVDDHHNDNSYKSWRSSTYSGGSPGKKDDTPFLNYNVRITEVLTNTNNLGSDAVEIYNDSNVEVDLTGWLLSDEKEKPGKYVFPSGSVLSANSYMVLDESDFNPNGTGFSLSSKGDEIHLFSASSGLLTGYAHGWDFGAQEANRTFGEHTNTQGEVFYTTLSTTTLGTSNATPLIGPLVFDKVMYHPDTTNPVFKQDEFIVIKNISDSIVELINTRLPDSNAFQITGISFEFPLASGYEIQPNESIILTNIPAGQFRSKYSIDTDAQIFQYTGVLSNGGEKIQIRYPLSRDILSDGSYDNHYVVVEELNYDDKSPWPELADGDGYYLIRSSLEFATDPNHWGISKESVLRQESLGTHHLINEFAITLFPNPSQDYLSVTSEVDIQSFDIVDLLGRTISTNENADRIHVGDLNKGTYFLNITLSSGQVISKTFVKN